MKLNVLSESIYRGGISEVSINEKQLLILLMSFTGLPIRAVVRRTIDLCDFMDRSIRTIPLRQWFALPSRCDRIHDCFARRSVGNGSDMGPS